MGNNLGPILKTLRKNKNMTIEELSKKLVISITDISKIENNKVDIPISVLMKYSKFFNISLDELCMNNIKYTEASFENAIYFVNKIEEISLRNNINFDFGNSFDMDMVESCIDLYVFTNDFSESKYFKVISLFKLIMRANDELIQMFQIFGKMILAKNNKRNLEKK